MTGRASGSWPREAATTVSAALREPERSPLGDLLDDAPSERVVRRIWQQIDRGQGKRAFPDLGFAVAAALSVVVVVVFSLFLRGPGPLEGTEGEIPAALVAESGRRSLALSDGSAIILEPEGRLEVLGNDDRTFVTALRAGQATFEVEPGGPRRWVVEAGLVSVEVVGTAFRVERSPTSVRVEVLRGVVIVRGDVAGGEQRLTRGQSITVSEPPAGDGAAGERASTQPAKDAPASERSEAPRVTLSELEDVVDPWGEEEDAKAARSATPSTGTRPPPSPRDFSAPAPSEWAPSPTPAPPATDESLEQLPSDEEDELQLDDVENPLLALDPVDEALQAADEARRAGDVAAATRLYEQAMRLASPSDSRRGLAALSFARTSSSPVQVARVLRSGLPSMPPSLREAALARLIEAEAAAGDEVQAHFHAREYLRLYPNGPRADSVRRLSGLP